MATAPSLNSSEVEALHEAFHYTLRASLEHTLNTDSERVAIGLIALSAPPIERLAPLSESKKAAMIMVVRYASIRVDDEKRLLSGPEDITLEEIAEQAIRTPVYGSRRAIDVATIAALHSLNWARQHHKQ